MRYLDHPCDYFCFMKDGRTFGTGFFTVVALIIFFITGGYILTINSISKQECFIIDTTHINGTCAWVDICDNRNAKSCTARNTCEQDELNNVTGTCCRGDKTCGTSYTYCLEVRVNVLVNGEKDTFARVKCPNKNMECYDYYIDLLQVNSTVSCWEHDDKLVFDKPTPPTATKNVFLIAIIGFGVCLPLYIWSYWCKPTELDYEMGAYPRPPNPQPVAPPQSGTIVLPSTGYVQVHEMV